MKRKLILWMGTLSVCIVFMLIFIYTPAEDRMSEYELEKFLIESMKETEQEQQKVGELLMAGPRHLKRNGYPGIDVSFSLTERELTVHIQDKHTFENHKNKIKEIVVGAGKEAGLEGFEVDFMFAGKHGKRNEEKKIAESGKQVLDIVSDSLKEEEMPASSSVIVPNEEITIELLATHVDERKKRSLKEVISNKVYSKTHVNYRVTVKERSKSRTTDRAWSPIFTSIRHQISKHFDEYRGFAYSFHPEPLQVIIKTDIGFWTWDRYRKAKRIEWYVDKIIELKREELDVEEIPYEIVIRDKNDKRMN